MPWRDCLFHARRELIRQISRPLTAEQDTHQLRGQMGVVNLSGTTAAGPSFFFDYDALRALALEQRAAFAAASPFPHVVLDSFLGEAIARQLAAVFPGPDHPDWKRRDHKEQAARLGQLQRTAFEGVDAALRHLLNELSSMSFLDFLEKLTGIQGLIPDAHFRGGGLQLTLSGGHLSLHADFNRDRFRALTRRLTVMYYLNADWDLSFGGELELWNEPLTTCEVKLPPLLDRLVVMAHGDAYWHGHPSALQCPPSRGRAAVAAYFYTAEESATAPAPHSAIWVTPR